MSASLKKDIVEVLEASSMPLGVRSIMDDIKKLRVKRALQQLVDEGRIEETVRGWRLVT